MRFVLIQSKRNILLDMCELLEDLKRAIEQVLNKLFDARGEDVIKESAYIDLIETKNMR